MANNQIQPNSNTPVPSLEGLQDLIKRWNYLYPIDRWWRTKYKIPFNSKHHRKTDIIDMRIDYEEDFMYTQARNHAISQIIEPEYIPGRGDWLKTQKNQELSKEKVDELYDIVDISKIDETGGDTIVI